MGAVFSGLEQGSVGSVVHSAHREGRETEHVCVLSREMRFAINKEDRSNSYLLTDPVFVGMHEGGVSIYLV